VAHFAPEQWLTFARIIRNGYKIIFSVVWLPIFYIFVRIFLLII